MIIVLLVSTSFVGMSNTLEVENERYDLPNKLHYFCYNINDSSAKLDYYLDYMKRVKNDDIIEENRVIQAKEISSFKMPGGLMNSSWPMYCHDVRHTGQSPYSTEKVTAFEKARFYASDFVESGPSIASDGTIYFGNGGDLYAIDSNFNLKWKYETSGLLWGGSHPTIDENGTIYIGNYHGDFYAINPNGTLKWKYKAGMSICCSSAIDEDGTIYFGDFDGDINALHPNGTLKWKYRTGDAVLSCPAIGHDGTIYCGSHDYNLYALYPENGTVKWKFKTGHWVRVSPCIGDDGTIYFVSLDGWLRAVDPNGTLKWDVKVGAGTSPTIGHDGTIYAGYYTLHAIHPNGTIKWNFRPGDYQVIEGGTPCHSIDGTIYFGTRKIELGGGRIWAVSNNGTLKWNKKISRYFIDSPPAIGENGTVYIGSTGWWGYLHEFGPVESNNPPNPPIITGDSFGFQDRNCIHKFNVYDPDNNPVSFYIDWGDGTITNWTQEYASHQPIWWEHTWSKKGNYTIKAKAKDILGEESDWGYYDVEIGGTKLNKALLFGKIYNYEYKDYRDEIHFKAKRLLIVRFNPLIINIYKDGEKIIIDSRGMTIIWESKFWFGIINGWLLIE